MPQTRLGNFGYLAAVSLENAGRALVTPKGVYDGFELGVDASSDLTIAMGGGAQPDGILWFEDATTTLSFTPPSTATDYTVIASHTNREIKGGVKVSYDISGGLQSDASITDGVALGWIRHPGGGLPLIASYLQSAPKITSSTYASLLVETAPTDLIPPFPQTYLDTATLGVDITVTDMEFDVAAFTLYQSIARSVSGTTGTQYAVQHMQFYVGDNGYPPVSADFWINFPTTSMQQFKAEVYDTNQSPVTVTGGTITGTSGWETKSVDIDMSGTFDPGKPWTLRLTSQIAQGGEIKLGRVRVRTWPFP